jgi:hypothetical protein
VSVEANSYRIFDCARCQRRVVICRTCDDGHRYCPDRECALLARIEAKRRYRADYQDTHAGRRTHAKAQERYRRKVAAAELCVGMQVVTDHPSTTAPPSPTVLPETQTIPHEEEQHRERSIKSPSTLVRCAFCGRFCGPFVHRWFGRLL